MTFTYYAQYKGACGCRAEADTRAAIPAKCRHGNELRCVYPIPAKQPVGPFAHRPGPVEPKP
jgi:hypothetical protein